MSIEAIPTVAQLRARPPGFVTAVQVLGTKTIGDGR